MKFILVFSGLNRYAAGGRIYISLRRDKRLPHGVRGMQTPNLQRCRSSSQKIFARQIFFGSPVFILVRTAMQLCPHSHISLRYVVAANFAFHASVLTHIRKLCFVASPLPTKILRLFAGALPYPVRPCRGHFCGRFTNGFRSLSEQTVPPFRVHGTLAAEFYSSSVCRLSRRFASAVCFRPACVCRSKNT